MRRFGVLFLSLALGAGPLTAGVAFAAKAKARDKKGGGRAAAPPVEELNKLKAVQIGDPKGGVFTWGLSSNEVLEKLEAAVKARSTKSIEDANNDPARQQRLRDALRKEVKAIKDSYTKFDGQKSGWDVSIIGPEFSQNNGEAVIQTKEDIWTRYFFFFEDRLYKIFLAFNKDQIRGKSFQDFGRELAAKYGSPREVHRDEKQQGGVRRTLDHYEWGVSGGNSLRLVDRSEFYGVYCLVLSDASVTVQVAEKRKITNPEMDRKDALVEAIVGSKDSERDSNDDIIDRVTGREVKRPGDEPKHGNIQVPMPNAPAPSDVNTGDKGGGKKDRSASKKSGDDKKGAGLEL